ncbi:MAG: GNAT family N-acetyltransferase [Chlamydiae bacterium]|nr:GNAT family N-acetyltransferase [Chlamydiota bacterium]
MINGDIYLSEPLEKDIPSIIHHLQEKEIYDLTLQIPYPYDKKNAQDFITLVQSRKKRYGRLMDWAIRNSRNELVGMISFQGISSRDLENDEIGFWLAKPYWNQGIMTEVLKKFVEFGFKEYRYRRFTLSIFVFNEASSKVAEKCGFVFQGLAEKVHCKEGQLIDLKLYAIQNPKHPPGVSFN